MKIFHRLRKSAQEAKQSNIRAITRRVEAIGGINLSQGVCALEPRQDILKQASQAVLDGHNLYTSCEGIQGLRAALAKRYNTYNKVSFETNSIVVTSGATGAFESICKAFLNPGDEVLMFEPTYQYHVRQISDRGAQPVFVRLSPPDWNFAPESLARAITKKTKMCVFSNPNNPTGKVFSKPELEAVGDICKQNDVTVVVDEVYEYIVGEKYEHVSLASLPEMSENTITISSSSKTLFVTGWRVGWLAAPQSITAPLSIKFDDSYICAPTPFQHAAAYGFSLEDDFFDGIRVQFYSKRDRLLNALESAGFIPHVPNGAYYIMADYSQLGFKSDNEAVDALINRIGIGSVQGNAFYESSKSTGMLRFCFAVKDEILEEGCRRLQSL